MFKLILFLVPLLSVFANERKISFASDVPWKLPIVMSSFGSGQKDISSFSFDAEYTLSDYFLGLSLSSEQYFDTGRIDDAQEFSLYVSSLLLKLYETDEVEVSIRSSLNLGKKYFESDHYSNHLDRKKLNSYFTGASIDLRVIQDNDFF